MDLETLRLAEAFFSYAPEVWPLVRTLLLGAVERWPNVQIVTQRSQVGLSDPCPFCALYPPRKASDRKAHALGLSLFLPRPCPRSDMVVEAYPGRFTNHTVLHTAKELDADLWKWLTEAHDFRNHRKTP